MTSAPKPPEGGRPITGRTVLGWLIGFFLVIMIANAAFLWLALSSFSGIEATSAYKAGQTFTRDRAEAEAQSERGWQVEADIVRAGNGADIRIHARDRHGAPLPGMAFSATFKRPVADSSDTSVDLAEVESGVYAGHVGGIEAGQWSVVIIGEGVDRQTGEPAQMFVSQNRIVLRDRTPGN